ncbi:uncharacterized protein LOC112047120 isoform X3 [Bicyclus anynana]|uniref:Uncharacterized protein LOC112047120 isoform X3 n=1 Tax=Bicyclus anynana TaxID=110368 RepID=A0ABM3M268_BICAN|nr:uncharacterized protein LOC112047120 isoform X3 [Bicyclus anynana]
MLKQYYQHCVVPYCKNNRRNAPDKLYIRVPYESKLRKQWLDLARRDRIFSPRSSLYFCEDHFDLPKDMENYVQFKVQGYINKIRMKKGCLPSKFDCQPGRKRIASSVSPESVKKQRKELIEQTLAEYDMNITKISEAGNSRICRTEPTSTQQVPLPYSSKSQESKKLETYVSIEPKKEPIDLETEYTVPKEEPTDLDPLVSLENVDKCKCCLSEMELKTLWDQHEFEGDGEVYGEMLNECFGISWQPSAARESICEVCVVSLRQALQFKRAIIATQEILMGGVQAVKDHVKHEEDVDQSPTDVAYEDVQYLEEDCDDSPEVDVIKETIKEEINDLDEEIQWENLLHNPQKSNCLYCKEKFEVPLHSHMSEKHSEIVKNLTCEVCGEVFSWTSLLVAHKKKHNSRHKCVYCSKVFQNPHKLVSHMITHTHKNSSTIFI